MMATTMTRWLWIGTGFTALIWTLMTWGAYALLTVAGDAISGGVGVLGAWPDVEYWLSWSMRLAEQFGIVILVVTWAIGLLLLLILAWVAGRVGTRLLGEVRDSRDAR
jgi:hypothetical protein